MAVGFFSSNTTIKVNGPISNSSSISGSTLYTAPANGYGIINLHSNGAVTITIGGRTVLSSTTIIGSTASGTAAGTGFYVGPSQTVVFTSGGGVTVSVSGVEFVNTP